MRGRLWMFVGVLLGIGVAAGRVPYLAGAGRSFAASAEHLVLSGAQWLQNAAADRGAPQRVVLGFGGLIAILVPGLTSLLFVVAARATLKIRALVALLITVVGAASYAYQPHGIATGVLILALALAALAVAVTGPLVVAPLCFGAGLIAASFIPTLFTDRADVTRTAVESMHTALWGSPGDPVGLQVAMLVVALVPMAFAVKLLAD